MENHIFCLKKNIIFEMFEEGGVAFNLEDRGAHISNQTGTGILKLLNGNRNVQELIQILAQNWEQPEEVVKKDVNLFLMDLVARDWIYVKRK